ncbi:MAG: ATP-binding protein [Myxococcota bacterium]|nr:ATP-binding protein [Myxococcota bacterium]
MTYTSTNNHLTRHLHRGRAETSDALETIRRDVIRLALNEDDLEKLVPAALTAIATGLNCPCSFILNDGIAGTEALCSDAAFPVQVKGTTLGYLVFASDANEVLSYDRPTLQELADLLGLCAVRTEQDKVISELQEASEDVLFHAPDAIFVTDFEGVIQLANRCALEIIGAGSGDVEGQSIEQVLGWPLPGSSAYRDMAIRGQSAEIELNGANGRRLVSVSLSIIGESESGQVLNVLRDITEERQAQLAVRQSERFALMGETVAYLLHEMNNPLAALLASLTHARKRGDQVGENLERLEAVAERDPAIGVSEETLSSLCQALDQLKQGVDRAEQSGKRIQDTMATLRSIHRDARGKGPQLVDLGLELNLAIRVAEQETAAAVKIVRSDAPLQLVTAVPLQLAEALGAIVKNAIQAAQVRPDGRVEISTAQRGDTLRIVVSDNGPGMTESIRKRAFMPFFTTKPIGQALGLGLTLAEGAIHKMGGTICLESVVGKGTHAVVTLLVSQELV